MDRSAHDQHCHFDTFVTLSVNINPMCTAPKARAVKLEILLIFVTTGGDTDLHLEIKSV